MCRNEDPPPPKEPWESPLERKARRHREKAGCRKMRVLRKTEYGQELLVALPFVSSFLFLVVMPGGTSSVLVTCSI